MRKSFVDSQDASGMGTFEGLSKLLKGAGASPADPGTAKIPLSLLPSGAQPGQKITLIVSGVDSVSGTATVSPDTSAAAAPPAPVKAPDAVDKSLTLGPMDSVRSYLIQKTQDQGQENQ